MHTPQRETRKMAPAQKRQRSQNDAASPPRDFQSPSRPDITSPFVSASRITRASAPESPYSAFASSLPALSGSSPVRKGGGQEFSSHPPSSPFTGFASSLPTLGASPATPRNASIFHSGPKGALFSPGGWQPLSKACRSLIDDSLSVLDGGGVAPHTPRMQLICFGESSLTEVMLDSSESDSPLIVGSFGSFGLSLPGSSVKQSIASLAHNDSRNKRPPSRRKLETKEVKDTPKETKPAPTTPYNTRQVNGISKAVVKEDPESPKRRETDNSSSKKAASEEEPRRSTPSSSATKKDASPRDKSPAAAKPPPPRDPSKLCKCKKSKCIRQYCICFRAGLLCQGCDCVDCHNDGKHEEERQAAVDHIKTSDPLAFAEKVRPNGTTPPAGLLTTITEVNGTKVEQHVRGCKCKNSRCQKKYCECFEYGVSCSARCGCKDCLNGKPPQADGSSSDKKRKASALAGDTSSSRKDDTNCSASGKASGESERPMRMCTRKKARRHGSSSSSGESEEEDEEDEEDYSDEERDIDAPKFGEADSKFGGPKFGKGSKFGAEGTCSYPQTPQRVDFLRLTSPYTPLDQQIPMTAANLSFSSMACAMLGASPTHLSAMKDTMASPIAKSLRSTMGAVTPKLPLSPFATSLDTSSFECHPNTELSV